MALQSIKPEYKEWLISKAHKPVSSVFNDMTNDFNKLNDNILKGNTSDRELTSEIAHIRNKMLYISLLYSQDKIENPDKDWTKLDKIFNILQKNLKYINTYEETNIIRDQKSNINILTWINIIFLPLTLIVGYYGMNFASMGSPSKSSGPFSMRYGQLWVFGLFLSAIILTIGILFLFRKIS